MDDNKKLKIYATRKPGNLTISTLNTQNALDVANNKSRQYSELAKQYRDEAKGFRDDARTYAEQNADVTMEDINELENAIENALALKQPVGDYALKSELVTKTSELTNDANFVTSTQLSQSIATVQLPSQTGNSGKILTTDGTDASWTEQYSRNIGEVVVSSIPLTDAGLHLLDGTQLSGSGSYSAFVDYIADLYDSGDYTAIFDTEANWQSAVTTYGVCSKFVYDSVNNTVRLPKWGGQAFTTSNISTATTLPVKGTGMTLGLTNGTNDAGLSQNGSHLFNSQSAQYGKAVSTTTYGWNSPVDGALGVTTDSSKSGIVADISELTNQYGINCYYYIVVATTTKTNIQVDIDEIATDLNGKADVDLSNINASCKAIDGQWVASPLALAEGTSNPTSTAISYDLSSYLPNDNYNYEVIVAGLVYTGTTSGNAARLTLYTDIITTSTYICGCNTRTASTQRAYGSMIMPVGSERTLTVGTYDSNTGTFHLNLRGYRRIGTNS